jgi:hypothetical protein
VSSPESSLKIQESTQEPCFLLLPHSADEQFVNTTALLNAELTLISNRFAERHPLSKSRCFMTSLDCAAAAFNFNQCSLSLE